MQWKDWLGVAVKAGTTHRLAKPGGPLDVKLFSDFKIERTILSCGIEAYNG